MAWPITSDDVRKALGYKPGEGDEDELTLYAAVVSQRIDDFTGRNPAIGGDATRWLDDDGDVPPMFILAAREAAQLRWQQDRNGPQSPDTADDISGIPQGADLPRKVQGMLSNYPPRWGFGS